MAAAGFGRIFDGFEAGRLAETHAEFALQRRGRFSCEIVLTSLRVRLRGLLMVTHAVVLDRSVY